MYDSFKKDNTDKIEIMIDDRAGEVIKELFKSHQNR